MSFSEMSKFISDNLSNMNNVVVVPTFEVNSREEVDKYFDMFRKDGYEGAIIRTDAPYEHKRSKNLLKYKEFQDDEFEIVDVNIGKNQTIAESFTIKLKNDKLCNATLAFPDEVCKQILENKENYIGKMATVCYFGVTNDGLLRFPVVKAIDRQSYE
jgi:DNA ligase-1